MWFIRRLRRKTKKPAIDRGLSWLQPVLSGFKEWSGGDTNSLQIPPETRKFQLGTTQIPTQSQPERDGIPRKLPIYSTEWRRLGRC